MTSPTPWTVPHDDPTCIVDGNDHVIFRAPLTGFYAPREEIEKRAEQNCRLASHAPQMLEMLKDLLDTMERCSIEAASDILDIHVEVEIKKIRHMIESAEDITR